MLNTDVPVPVCCDMNLGPRSRGRGNSGTGEVFTAVSAGICFIGSIGGFVKCCRIARERSTRPRMTAKVERVLMSLCFILVLKTIVTVRTLILLFLFVCSKRGKLVYKKKSSPGYLLEIFLTIKFLGLLWTAFAHEYALNFRCPVGFSHAI